MSHHHFPSLGRYTVAELNLDEAHANGVGGFNSSGLVIPVSLDLRYPYERSGYAIQVRQLRCRLALENGSYLTPFVSQFVQVRLTAAPDHRALKNHSVYIEIPLDHARLSILERVRKGGNLHLKLDFELIAEELEEVTKTDPSCPAPLWGFKECYCLRVQAPCEIPRSVWVERVLHGTGYGTVYLIELSLVPITSCAGLKVAANALQQAQALYKQGLYDDAVGKCRVALEPFFESVKPVPGSDAKQVRVLKPSWQKHLGELTYNWLNASLKAIREPTHRPHHSSTLYFDALEAQLLMAVTTALIAYAVRTQPEDAALE